MKKRTMIFVTAMVLLFAMVTGSTLAYMTSQPGAVKNTFTYGSVAITLDEAKVNTLGKPVNANGQVVDLEDAPRQTSNNYRLYPGITYTKDPTIHVADDSEECYLFVKVVNPLASIEADGNTTIAKQMETLGWVAVDGETGVYYYNGTAQGGTTDTVSKSENIKVFETVSIATGASFGSLNPNGEDVTVEALAVQASGFTSVTNAWTNLGSEQPW